MTDIEWKFKDDAEYNADDFWYDITDGGYINPKELLSDDKQISELENAIAIVRSFEEAYIERQEESNDD